MNEEAQKALLLGILRGYVQLAWAGWPALHPDMPRRVAHWPRLSAAELRSELNRYLSEASSSPEGVRVYWKLGAGLSYAGANRHFLADVGARHVDEILGLDDFNPTFPWGAGQAARLRADDERLLRTGEALTRIEQQQVGVALNWSRVAKASIRDAAGTVRGLVGMYQRLDPELGRRLYYEQEARESARAV